MGRIKEKAGRSFPELIVSGKTGMSDPEVVRRSFKTTQIA